MPKKACIVKILFFHSGLIGLLILSLFTIQVFAADKSPSTSPNILLIMVDDMGYTDIGSFGGEIETPNIDVLAYFAPTAPHDPIHVPEPWLSKYHGQYDDGYKALKARRIAGAKRAGITPKSAPPPALHPKTKPWDSLSSAEKAVESRTMEAYAGMIENMDYHIGRIINFLKDIGEYGNTIIIFTSDNGPNPWYADEYPDNAGSEWMKQFDNSLENIGHPGSFVGIGIGWACASAGPLDYFKLTVGEGGIRTPLIIAGPGVKGPRQVDYFAYVTDIMPTILGIAKLEHPERFQGRKVERMRGRSLADVTFGTGQDIYALLSGVKCKTEDGCVRATIKRFWWPKSSV